MSSQDAPGAQTDSASRYELQAELGGGGMAVVHLVLDRETGRRLALKRPQRRADLEQRRKYDELFAREFHTLAQLAHPRIVEVYDYGIDDQGPYYTMELLDGGDLQQLVPADWRRVCAIARDVCSALSLLHSRRIVHRDISPRNIRCTEDGTAKLIDFGAMTPMGATKELVGTPVYCAPELLHMQPLDARTDLYALGATLYYALTGHHAYPARDFANLPNAWRFAIARPSELAPEVPEALDALVLDLLQLDPQSRPSHAAEVMQRLAAIEGKPVDEQLVVAQAYLATPAFVGREAELERVRERTLRAMRKRGGALLVRGVTGVGRTRFLDACVLSGKLLGATVLRADADDAEQGEYGAMRALLSQLLAAASAATKRAAAAEPGILAHALPDLAEGSQPEAIDAIALRPRLQSALRQLFVSVAETHPLLIAVDDLDRLDEPSSAALALLANGLKKSGILIVASCETGGQPLSAAALRLYSEAARELELEPLSLAEVKALLASIFGANAELDALVQRAFAVSHGSPRDVLRLAQHLVDRGVVRYQGGAWSLPNRIDAADLPSSVAQLLAARGQGLRDSARQLGCAFALCPEHSFSFDECVALGVEPDPARNARDLEQLLKVEILRAAGERYMLSDRAFAGVLLADLPAQLLAAAHLRLAHVFEARGHEQHFRVAQHLLRAGERDRALDLFVVHAMHSQQLTDASPEEFYKLISSLPEDWLQTYEEALALCEQLRRPAAQQFVLRNRLAGLVAVIGLRDSPHIRELITQLRGPSGLDDWDQADATLEHMPRLVQALERTQARYNAASEQERVLEPVHAVRAMSRATMTQVASATPVFDIASLRALPSLEPLFPLSPALGVVQNLAQGVLARLTGRTDKAREIYLALLERTAQPDRAGFDESHHRYMRVLVMNGLAMIAASMGLDSSLTWADQIQADPLFHVNAVLIRMLHQLWQGNAQEAERLRDELELLRVQSSARQAFENTHLLWQVTAHAAMEDLTRLKRTLDEIERVAADYAGWQPVREFARAEYQRVRGDFASAITIASEALARTPAGEHQIWPNLAGTHVRALDDAGDPAQAVTRGLEYLQQAERAELGFGCIYVLLPLCVAQAKAGHAGAVANAERVLESLRQVGSSGLVLGLAYEARARVALTQTDHATYVRYADLCKEVFAPAANPALFAKAQRLRRDAERKHVSRPAARLPKAAQRLIGSTIMKAKMRACTRPEQRAQLALDLLAEQSCASDGLLYHVTADGPRWVASVGSLAPNEALLAMARDYIAGETHGQSATTGAEGHTEHETEWTAFGEASFRPVLLSHYTGDGYAITGLAVFAAVPGQPFMYPGDTAAQLSRLWVEIGDVTAVTVVEDE
ncbi:MAG TPA: protein kinase [Polyangiales bacterium]|nr:protein kinase [Polyangiales bacterium]